jgi:hypothetical protein
MRWKPRKRENDMQTRELAKVGLKTEVISDYGQNTNTMMGRSSGRVLCALAGLGVPLCQRLDSVSRYSRLQGLIFPSALSDSRSQLPSTIRIPSIQMTGHSARWPPVELDGLDRGMDMKDSVRHGIVWQGSGGGGVGLAGEHFAAQKVNTTVPSIGLWQKAKDDVCTLGVS